MPSASAIEKPAAHYLLYDSALELSAVAEFCAAENIALLPWAERDALPTDARVLLYCGDEQIRELAPLALERRWEVGVLPHPQAVQACASLGVEGELSALLPHYLAAPVIAADALTCNGELVFSSVVIGRVLALRPEDIDRPQTAWSMFKGALQGLGKLRLAPYKLITAKEREVSMAALGMVALGQTQSRLTTRTFADELDIADGRVTLLTLAPRSNLAYLRFLVRLLRAAPIDLSRLPPSLGLLQSSRLHISAPKGTEYLLDGKPVTATEIDLEVQEQRLQLLPGPALVLRQTESRSADKETVRLNNVPIDAAVDSLVDKPLPLFSHADEEEYRELFVALRSNAAASSSFQVLMILSVLLALTGLYANSAPVIIGAMILAPLMAPIMSLGMALARTDAPLLQRSLRTLGVGVFWGLLCAVLLAWAMPLDLPTPEMKARMTPTLLDLLVAVLSGVAGAYASAKEEVAKSLAGVAIAVALVPPLAVAGIGLGWGDWAMAQSAGLLLLTNLVGMSLAAGATFMVLGFTPFKRARTGLTGVLLLVLVISLPLTLSFAHLVKRDRLLSNVPAGEVELLGLPVTIGAVDVVSQSPPLVRLAISAAETPGTDQVDALKDLISERVGETVVIEVQVNIRR